MKTNATLSARCSAKRLIAAAIITVGLAGAPALAQEDEPVTDESVGAKDVAMTPISDLNLKSDPIPDLLVAAREDPYKNEGLAKCSDYAAAVRELDAILGVDWDVATPEERRLTAGKVAQSVVGSLIPFRGVIREVSGAADHERDFQEAILAGMMRRAYLKGMGLKLGCQYPARPADEATRVRVQAELAAAAAAAEDAED